jgi:hypothetical protein
MKQISLHSDFGYGGQRAVAIGCRIGDSIVTDEQFHGAT